MKTIIIPADLSNAFYNCLNMAMMFEQARALDIIIVFENKQFEMDYFDKFEEIILNFQTAFIHPESTLQLHITEKKLEDEVCALINENPDSVFCSTFHETPDALKHGYTKENALNLMKTTAHHVLTLPTDKIPPSFDRIIFPVHNLSKIRHKVTLTAKIASLFNSEVHVLNTQVSNKPSVIKQCTLYAQQVTRHFRNVGVNAKLIHMEGDNVAGTVMEYASTHRGDLIAVIPEPKGKGAFGKKSYIREMVMYSKLPLLVVGPRKLRVTK
ncbi:MAG: hypothetical protein ACOC0C_08650 [Bacteroidota bacterium]